MNDAEKRIREALAAGHTAGGMVFDATPENITALLAEIDRLRAATSRPRDAGDPTYPDAERCAQTMERCEEDLLTEAQFVRWQGQEIDRLTRELAEAHAEIERLRGSLRSVSKATSRPEAALIVDEALIPKEPK